jgi:cytochrome c-type biogenesis protein CcmH/NrfF
MRRLAAALLASALMALPAASAAAVTPRASLTDVEQDVMCVVCKQPLAVSQSPQADRERAFINQLIAKGLTKAQIERQLVGQYGPSVLALPPASGFNLTVYVLPPVLVVIGVGLLVYLLPRWRRRARADARAQPAGSTLAPADSQRLDEELARFGR